VRSPSDNANHSILAATLGRNVDIPPEPGREAAATQLMAGAAQRKEAAFLIDNQAIAKDSQNSRRSPQGLPTDPQGRAVLSKKSGQITFDITRSDVQEKEATLSTGSSPCRELQSPHILSMLSKEDLALLDKLPHDQKQKMIEYLNTIFAAQ